MANRDTFSDDFTAFCGRSITSLFLVYDGLSLRLLHNLHYFDKSFICVCFGIGYGVSGNKNSNKCDY